MDTPLTKEYFDETLQKLLGLVATQEDLKGIREELTMLRESVGKLSSSVDAFAVQYRRDTPERAVLVQKVNRIKQTLVAKGIAREDELAV